MSEIKASSFRLEVKSQCPTTLKHESNSVEEILFISVGQNVGILDNDSIDVFIKDCNSCGKGHYINIEY